jgi:hypothetical protein
MMFEWNTLIYIVIPVIHRNYDANDALTANIHVVIPVIDQNYDINGIVRENLAKSRELYRNSGHSPELGY